MITGRMLLLKSKMFNPGIGDLKILILYCVTIISAWILHEFMGKTAPSTHMLPRMSLTLPTCSQNELNIFPVTLPTISVRFMKDGNPLQVRTIPPEFPEPVGEFPKMYSLGRRVPQDVLQQHNNMTALLLNTARSITGSFIFQRTTSNL
jgi:hypothetical protein